MSENQTPAIKIMEFSVSNNLEAKKPLKMFEYIKIIHLNHKTITLTFPSTSSLKSINQKISQTGSY